MIISSSDSDAGIADLLQPSLMSFQRQCTLRCWSPLPGRCEQQGIPLHNPSYNHSPVRQCLQLTLNLLLTHKHASSPPSLPMPSSSPPAGRGAWWVAGHSATLPARAPTAPVARASPSLLTTARPCTVCAAQHSPPLHSCFTAAVVRRRQRPGLAMFASDQHQRKQLCQSLSGHDGSVLLYMTALHSAGKEQWSESAAPCHRDSKAA